MTENDKALVERLRRRANTYQWDSTTYYVSDANLMRQAADAIEALAAEKAALREELRKAKQAHWFYFGEDYESDKCRFGIDECISEDFEWDNKPEGDHVLLITGARPVPDMWVALHYYTEAEKEARGSDDEYTYTVHATNEEAEIALIDFRAASRKGITNDRRSINPRLLPQRADQ